MLEGCLVTCDVPMKEFVRYIDAKDHQNAMIKDDFKEEDVSNDKVEYLDAGGTNTIYVSRAARCQTCESARARATASSKAANAQCDDDCKDGDYLKSTCAVCTGRRRHVLVEPSFVPEILSSVQTYIKQNTFEDESSRTEY